MNLYDSPDIRPTEDHVALTRDIIERLVAGQGVEDLVFYDVSDQQLYGRKNCQRLTGEVARRASESGYDTIVFQSVLWWCLVFIPIVPLSVYTVIPKLECDDPDGDAAQYRGIPLGWDWRQITIQYMIVAIILGLIAALVWWCLASA